jgi:hypothetical protein
MPVEFLTRDKDGAELHPGDIVEVTVKYRVLKINDRSILAEKVYDVPSNAVKKTGEVILP